MRSTKKHRPHLRSQRIQDAPAPSPDPSCYTPLMDKRVARAPEFLCVCKCGQALLRLIRARCQVFLQASGVSMLAPGSNYKV